MVYIRQKIIRGISYSYLVESEWSSEKKQSRQVVLKYLGKTSSLTVDMIPFQFRHQPRVRAFLISVSPKIEERVKQIKSFRNELIGLLLKADRVGCRRLYQTASPSFDLLSFYEELLIPALHTVGELWENKRLTVADEHVASNCAVGLIDVITGKALSKRSRSLETHPSILLCTPYGELHNIANKIIESILVTRGFPVLNLGPSCPIEDIIKSARKSKPDLVMISITIDSNLRSAVRLVNELTNLGVRVIVGGQALAYGKNRTQLADAEFAESISEAVDRVPAN